jgi:GNAT superfamily N-acetyltransferase
LGVVSLIENNLDTRPDLGPWLAGTYVAPPHRGRGVASALVRHAVGEARRMGIARLYLYTAAARGLYEKLGWRPIAEDAHAGRPITIMAIDAIDTRSA